jgi:hypothetical protein
MNYLSLRIWLIMSVTLAISAVIIRLAWEIAFITAAPSLVMIILLIFAIMSIYALFIYFTIKPDLKKLKSLPVAIGITVLTTAAISAVIIHFVRFVPSPEAAVPLSVVIAVLLLMAGISAYLLVIWVIWFIRKA